MFPNTTIDELTSDQVYAFGLTDPVYLEVLEYYAAMFDDLHSRERWSRSDPETRSGKLWWVMNGGWKAYGTLNPNVPVCWLAISKRALQLDHMPSNFHPWALGILEKFDLARYQAAYHLPPEEYEAIARDLPVVLQRLREYPPEKFGPPIDETNWGFNDQ
ncbi:hypothetical protein KBW71_05910 [Hydrogenophaga aromaticivorans]|uniref:hypothetical protein n=1 Tax=Hydrogenophaga aromaticivorans TaxID=2610898 RepID=UPI0003F3D0A2|nr:hypothetical protein [Hydrogenophaga aromaticivorans]EWS65850.1 hypothetical protein Y695_00892 [Hydrogenophaga sp. T4]MBQ0917971.1 hypothetical protein [Hydrogenophaga aromaticivorans]